MFEHDERRTASEIAIDIQQLRAAADAGHISAAAHRAAEAALLIELAGVASASRRPAASTRVAPTLRADAPTVEDSTPRTELESTNCKNCGAPLQFGAGNTTVVCSACGGNFVRHVSPPAPPIRMERTSGVLPHSVDRQRFLAEFARWLSDGEFTPDDVLVASSVEYEPLLVPVYRFTGRFQGDWTASIGHNHEEVYPAIETRYRDGEHRQVEVQKTRTVTVWTPASGQVHGYFDVVVAGTTILEEQALVGAECVTIEQGSLQEGADGAAVGARLLEFDLTEEDGWARRGYPKVGERVRAAVDRQLTGDKQKQVHTIFTVDFGTPEQLHLPIWRALYGYGDQRFAFVLDGRDPSRGGLGVRPIDLERRARELGALAPAGAITIVALVWGLAESALPPWPLLVGAPLAWGIGISQLAGIETASQALRQTQLETVLRRIASGGTTVGGGASAQRQSAERGFVTGAAEAGWIPAVAMLVMLLGWLAMFAVGGLVEWFSRPPDSAPAVVGGRAAQTVDFTTFTPKKLVETLQLPEVKTVLDANLPGCVSEVQPGAHLSSWSGRSAVADSPTSFHAEMGLSVYDPDGAHESWSGSLLWALGDDGMVSLTVKCERPPAWRR